MASNKLGGNDSANVNNEVIGGKHNNDVSQLPQISSPTPSSSAIPPPLRGNGRRNDAHQLVASTQQSKGGQLTASEQYKSSGATSIQGTKPNNPKWINQDNFFVLESFDDTKTHFFCVLDGHGEVGHLVSTRCRDVFKQFIKASNLDMKKAFSMMQNDLMIFTVFM